MSATGMRFSSDSLLIARPMDIGAKMLATLLQPRMRKHTTARKRFNAPSGQK